MDFAKPTIEYAQLWPMLVVFGVACLGVVVEAFVPRERRYLTQAGAGRRRARGRARPARSTSASTSTSSRPRVDVVARGKLAAEGTLAVDGPSVFIWGLVLVFAIGGVLLFAERRLEAGVSRRSPARPPRCPAPRPSARRRPAAWTTPRSTRC